MSNGKAYDAQFNYMILLLFKDAGAKLTSLDITNMLEENKLLWKDKSKCLSKDGFYNEIRSRAFKLSKKENAIKDIDKVGGSFIYARGEESIFKESLWQYGRKVLMELDMGNKENIILTREQIGELMSEFAAV